MGDTSDASIKIAAEYLDNMNNNSAIASKDLHIAHTLTGTVTLKLKDDAAAILEMALYGTNVVETGGAFTATPFPTGLVAGGTYRIPGQRANLSALIIKDGSGSPVTLTLGTHYSADLKNGTITIISLTAGGAKVQPLTAEGTEVVGQQSVAMMNKRSQEKYLIVEGINVANGDKSVLADLYRVAFGPASEVMLKGSGNDPQSYEFEGETLADPLKDPDSTFGRYGRYRKLE